MNDLSLQDLKEELKRFEYMRSIKISVPASVVFPYLNLGCNWAVNLFLMPQNEPLHGCKNENKCDRRRKNKAKPNAEGFPQSFILEKTEKSRDNFNFTIRISCTLSEHKAEYFRFSLLAQSNMGSQIIWSTDLHARIMNQSARDIAKEKRKREQEAKALQRIPLKSQKTTIQLGETQSPNTHFPFTTSHSIAMYKDDGMNVDEVSYRDFPTSEDTPPSDFDYNSPGCEDADSDLSPHGDSDCEPESAPTPMLVTHQEPILPNGNSDLEQLAAQMLASLYLSYNPKRMDSFNRSFTIRFQGAHFIDKIAVFNEDIPYAAFNPNRQQYSEMMFNRQYREFIFVQFTDEHGEEIPAGQIGLITPEGEHFFRVIPKVQDKITLHLATSFPEEKIFVRATLITSRKTETLYSTRLDLLNENLFLRFDNKP
eukprot:TRINITY_DN1607_c0_g1_i4.p1 TRINITY_DN1607_c0_g1~~TRINITY_DN1607_c0_g1_i4.p1  ORF type:complete len:425 (+),score=66.80 TRINITY_DN1607_c0_g1_i4:182-1456(+)